MTVKNQSNFRSPNFNSKSPSNPASFHFNFTFPNQKMPNQAKHTFISYAHAFTSPQKASPAHATLFLCSQTLYSISISKCKQKPHDIVWPHDHKNLSQ